MRGDRRFRCGRSTIEDFLGYPGSRPSGGFTAQPTQARPYCCPAPAVDPDHRIELRNKNARYVGYQLTNRLHNPERRTALNDTIERVDELLFEPKQVVHCAVVSLLRIAGPPAMGY